MLSVGFVLIVAIYVQTAILFGVYTPELFPTEIRLRANGICNTLGRGATVVSPFVVGYLMANYQLPGVVWLMIGLVVIQIVVVWVWGVEPRNRALEGRDRQARLSQADLRDMVGRPALLGRPIAWSRQKMSGLRPVTVITGASAGIGVALARVFARNGHELALVARREDRLRALADEIAATGARRPIVIVADLAQPTPPGRSARRWPRRAPSRNSWSTMPASAWSAWPPRATATSNWR